MKIRILFISFFSILSFGAQAQIDEPARNGMSRAEFMTAIIDSLELARSTEDTLNIIKYAAVLTTHMHATRMHERSKSYLDMALTYSRAFSDQRWYADVCNRAGMYYFAQRQPVLGDSQRLVLNRDKSLKWHHMAARLGHEMDRKGTEGWAYKGIMNYYWDHLAPLTHEGDSLRKYYEKAIRIASEMEDHQLFRSAAITMASYLTYDHNYEESLEILAGLQPYIDVMDNRQKSSYYRKIHDLLAAQAGLDTLISLSWQTTLYYREAIAAEHESELYEADQKFEVSKTRDSLNETEAQLGMATKAIIIISVACIAFVALLVYLYKLYQRNKRLSLRNELLVREQNHRVKNNLQMISSLLSLQAVRAKDQESREALSQSQGRIQAIALLNRSLYDQEDIADVDLNVYIRELIEEVVNSITDQEVNYELDIESLKLDFEKTTSLGLIINELIVNSVKYVKEKMVSFNLKLHQSGDQVHIAYSDNGQTFDLDEYRQSKSFGKRLIELQTRQLKGKMNLADGNQFGFEMVFTR